MSSGLSSPESRLNLAMSYEETDRNEEITRVHVDQAKELLIERQDTHLDSLAERLLESRVRGVLEPILAGTALPDVPEDDRRFVVDLGLVERTQEGGLDVANPIYREVIPRVLARGPQDPLPRIAPTWLLPEGRLDTRALLEAFVAFWRQHGEALLGSAPYHEIAPHLVLMAFLHRIANAGGSIEREYAIGRGRMDLCLRYGGSTVAMELKVWRDGEANPVTGGLRQLDGYLAGLGLDTGWLIIFDRRCGQPRIVDRTRTEELVSPRGRTVTVVWA